MEYRNNQLGFLIEYPEGVYITKGDLEKGILLWRRDQNVDELYEVSVLVLSKKEVEMNKDKPIRVERIKINGVSAKKYYWGGVVEVKVWVGEKVVQMVLINGNDREANLRFERMVNSFRLIN